MLGRWNKIPTFVGSIIMMDYLNKNLKIYYHENNT